MSQPLQSIVHEYNVLYSSRIHQRDKRWSDGILRFYEFNSKLEVANEHGIIITTDFIKNKPNSHTLSKTLVPDNEFKLPNNKLILQISDKISVYERDISRMFVQQETQHKPVVKLEPLDTMLTSVNTSLLNSSIPRRRRVGLRRIVKLEPGLENSIAKSSSSYLPQMPVVGKPKIEAPTIRVKTEVGTATPIINRVPKSRIEKPFIQPQPRKPSTMTSTPSKTHSKSSASSNISPLSEKPISVNQLTPDMLRTFRSLQRIPPMSARHFRYLLAVLGSEPVQELVNTVRSPSVVDIKVEEEIPIQSTKGLEEADIIYDLSDFEEDERFLNMLKQMKNQRELNKEDPQDQSSHTEARLSMASSFGTPKSLMHGLLTPITAKAKKFNEVHEFDLSTYSDFEDIDL